MQLVLFDTLERSALYPFTHTRPVADIRCGILTARERWESLIHHTNSCSLTEHYLQGVYCAANEGAACLLINGQILGTREMAEAVSGLNAGEVLCVGITVIAAVIEGELPAFEQVEDALKQMERKGYEGELRMLRRPWDIFAQNEWAIKNDYDILTEGKESAEVPRGVTVSGEQVFLEEGAMIGAGTIINAIGGPVYIGKGAEIMEGCMVRGPFALCEGAVLKMGAKIYSGTTIGPGCKVGGEVSNVVFFANSNKGHDGFLGNAVVGEWCNLGADTNSSNLKNNYDEVKVWDEATQKGVRTGLTFCGLIMGDHSKCGINTMFNTGTVAGVSCNIWGGGFPEKFIPSFSWGGPDGMSTYQFDRAMETAGRMMGRRGKQLNDVERAMLQHVFDATTSSRSLIFKD
jgi:UDP-N-acetylglucosamine diphosphorylase/glucosamine-1-phosphate N-acetyltransferase